MRKLAIVLRGLGINRKRVGHVVFNAGLFAIELAGHQTINYYFLL